MVVVVRAVVMIAVMIMAAVIMAAVARPHAFLILIPAITPPPAVAAVMVGVVIVPALVRRLRK